MKQSCWPADGLKSLVAAARVFTSKGSARAETNQSPWRVEVRAPDRPRLDSRLLLWHLSLDSTPQHHLAPGRFSGSKNIMSNQRSAATIAVASHTMSQSLDAHQRPPTHLRNVYKKFQKLRGSALESDPDLLDLTRPTTRDQLRVIRTIDPANTHILFQEFARAESSATEPLAAPIASAPVPVYEHPHMPGTPRVASVVATSSP